MTKTRFYSPLSTSRKKAKKYEGNKLSKAKQLWKRFESVSTGTILDFLIGIKMEKMEGNHDEVHGIPILSVWKLVEIFTT